MRLYLAGAESWLKAIEHQRGINVLFSYYYARKKFPELLAFSEQRGFKVFLDSGAYSAFTKNATIRIDEYIDFCLEFGARVEVVSALDVIGDWKASALNYDLMRSAGIDCVPVFHVRSPWSELERLVTEYDYIAFGIAGMQARRKSLGAWLLHAFNLVRNSNPLCKVHGFAITSYELMRAFPFHSIDSSTWIEASKHAEIAIHKSDRLYRLGKQKRTEIFREIRNSLTIPPDIEHLFLPRTATIEQYLPLYRHNSQCWIDAAKRLGKQKETNLSEWTKDKR